jgi:hypothetical protein
MSLAIDVDRINRVLLADGWHAVKGGSFDLDSYEYIDVGPEYNPDLDDLQMGKEQFEQRARQTLHGGGQSGVCATGFAFRSEEEGKVIAGPLTAILAVEYRDGRAGDGHGMVTNAS